MKNKFALWSFIIGMLAIVTVLRILIINTLDYTFLIIPILATLSLVFGIIGIKKSKELGGKTLAIIGTIFGSVVLALILYFIIMPKKL